MQTVLILMLCLAGLIHSFPVQSRARTYDIKRARNMGLRMMCALHPRNCPSRGTKRTRATAVIHERPALEGSQTAAMSAALRLIAGNEERYPPPTQEKPANEGRSTTQEDADEFWQSLKSSLQDRPAPTSLLTRYFPTETVYDQGYNESRDYGPEVLNGDVTAESKWPPPGRDYGVEAEQEDVGQPLRRREEENEEVPIIDYEIRMPQTIRYI